MKTDKQDWKILKWMLSLSKKQLPSILLSVMVNAGYAACSVFFALACRQVINAATDQDKSHVFQEAALLFGVILAQILLRMLKRWLAEHIKAKLEITYKNKIYADILQKDYAQTSRYHSGELLNRLFSDVSIISDGLATFLPGLVEMITMLCSASIVLLSLDSTFTLIFLIGGTILFAFTKIFRKKMKDMHKLVQEKDGKVRSFLQESIESLLIVKVFHISDYMEQQAEALQQSHYEAKMKRCDISILANTGFSVLFQFSYFYALLWGSMRLLSKQMNFGTLTALLQLVRQIQQPFANLSGFFPRYYSIIASGERLYELSSLSEEPGSQLLQNRQEVYQNMECLVFRNITFRYDRELVLKNASLSIQKYDFVAIEGISGIGKSTLLKLLLGVYTAEKGDIYLQLKNDAKLYADRSTRPLFSYVPQGNYLLSGTIRENITLLQPEADEEAIYKALQISCAMTFISELPDGLDTLIKEKGMGLSEGQIQRLAIARALLSQSPILLLDEATSALDEQTEEQLLQNLRTLNELTLIIVSHKKAALKICNKWIQIQHNKILCTEVENGKDTRISFESAKSSNK